MIGHLNYVLTPFNQMANLVRAALMRWVFLLQLVVVVKHGHGIVHFFDSALLIFFILWFIFVNASNQTFLYVVKA